MVSFGSTYSRLHEIEQTLAWFQERVGERKGDKPSNGKDEEGKELALEV